MSTNRLTPSPRGNRYRSPNFVERAVAYLDAMEAVATSDKRSFWSVGGCLPVRLPDAQVDRAAKLAEDVAEKGGEGAKFAMSSLLGIMLAGNDERLIPAWERMLLPHSRFGRRDVTMGVRARKAGQALRLLLLDGVEAALEPVFRFAEAVPPNHVGDHLVRTLVLLQVLGRDTDARAFAEVVTRLATEADSLELRYMARVALCNAELPIPCGHGDGFYTFLVTYQGFSCVIEVAGNDSVVSLRNAILDALEWDTDHAWCIYLHGSTGKDLPRWPIEELMFDPPYPWDDDEEATGEEADDATFDEEDDEEEEDDVYDPEDLRDLASDGELDLAVPSLVGELGLRTGNRITLYCAGGDHRVSVKVGRIGQKKVASVHYPRVTQTKGERPKQYRQW